MSSNIAPERSTIRRFTLLVLACTMVLAFSSPTAAAVATDCAPGTGGLGSAFGIGHGFVQAWNCASVTYHDTGSGTDVGVSALGTDTSVTA